MGDKLIRPLLLKEGDDFYSKFKFTSQCLIIIEGLSLCTCP